MNKKELELLKNTADDDLLTTFPGHKRRELRRIKKSLTTKPEKLPMTKERLELLRNTYYEDLLFTFPGYKRRELFRMKRLLPPLPIAPVKLPKILIFDIETAPMLVHVWNCGEQRININQIEKDWFILSWSAKWLFDSEVIHDVVTGKEARNRNDKRIVKHLWKLIDEADIIMAHNLMNFDRKKANTRFLKYGLNHPSPYKTIDTLQIARREFKVSSNKLDYLCKFLGLNVKTGTGFDLWKECMNGNKESLKKMDRYCQNDVKILEELYLKLRPYIHGHPNCGLYMDTDDIVCPNCGSNDLRWGNIYRTGASRYKVARCECGAMVRNKTSMTNRTNGRSLI